MHFDFSFSIGLGLGLGLLKPYFGLDLIDPWSSLILNLDFSHCRKIFKKI